MLPGPFAGKVQNENKPSQYDPNGPPPPQFRIVHAVRISHDGLVYVCDRTNDRLQVFKKDGTFVQEPFIAKETFGSGSVWDIGFSTDPEQTFAIVIDGTNQQVYVLRRKTLEVVSTFGGAGHWAGQFYGAHNLAIDSTRQPLHHRDLRGQARADVHARRASRPSAQPPDRGAAPSAPAPGRPVTAAPAISAEAATDHARIEAARLPLSTLASTPVQHHRRDRRRARRLRRSSDTPAQNQRQDVARLPPSAMRMPISVVRCATLKAITP